MRTVFWFVLVLVPALTCRDPSRPEVPSGGVLQELTVPTVGPSPCHPGECWWEMEYLRPVTDDEKRRCRGSDSIHSREQWCCGFRRCRLILREESCR